MQRFGQYSANELIMSGRRQVVHISVQESPLLPLVMWFCPSNVGFLSCTDCAYKALARSLEPLRPMPSLVFGRALLDHTLYLCTPPTQTNALDSEPLGNHRLRMTMRNDVRGRANRHT